MFIFGIKYRTGSSNNIFFRKVRQNNFHKSDAENAILSFEKEYDFKSIDKTKEPPCLPIILGHTALLQLLKYFSFLFTYSHKNDFYDCSSTNLVIEDLVRMDGYTCNIFDQEGTFTKNKKLLLNGKIDSIMIDRSDAEKINAEPSGNRHLSSKIDLLPNNLYIHPSDDVKNIFTDYILVEVIKTFNMSNNSDLKNIILPVTCFYVRENKKIGSCEKYLRFDIFKILADSVAFSDIENIGEGISCTLYSKYFNLV